MGSNAYSGAFVCILICQRNSDYYREQYHILYFIIVVVKEQSKTIWMWIRWWQNGRKYYCSPLCRHRFIRTDRLFWHIYIWVEGREKKIHIWKIIINIITARRIYYFNRFVTIRVCSCFNFHAANDGFYCVRQEETGGKNCQKITIMIFLSSSNKVAVKLCSKPALKEKLSSCFRHSDF